MKDILMKTCPKCKINQPLENYYANKRSKDGLGWTCKICVDVGIERYRANNLDMIRLRGKLQRRMRRANDPSKYRIINVMSRIKLLHKRKNVPYNVNSEFMGKLFNDTKSCQCCGRVLNYGSGTHNNNNNCSDRPFDIATIDRIIPKIGYMKSNIAVLCWRCNRVKNDASLDELEKVVAYMKTRVPHRKMHIA